MKIVALLYFNHKEHKSLREERRNILSVTNIKMLCPN
ncbi:hypothetical protein FLACOL7796_00782 [Flavobacterium collinsii]|uniref:Uncharacterized protein n=1 Tax=Flavobacterium collinsii TaxID=1114861 RepID=A0ABN7EFT9_9FLAO|nr:hypothetical protein FLACOL7796_00782 [Flavobacterium collinsii]